MKRSAPTPTEMSSPGAFMPDGSFNPEAGWSQQGPAHALVMSLIRERKKGMTPAEAAKLIHSARGEAAFPYANQWETAGPWWATWSSTSSEQAVRSAGEWPDDDR